MNEHIAKAVIILRSSRSLEDNAILRILVDDGMERTLAARMVEFVSLAYGRFLLAKSGARFSDYFQRMVSGVISAEQPLSSEPVWNAALDFARSEALAGISSEEFLAVVVRSAEFNAANQMLHRGSQLKNLSFTPCLLPWPENESDD